MKKLKVGDVLLVSGEKRTVLEVFTQSVLLSLGDTPNLAAGCYTLDELKDYTLVQPEKTLEEKFDDYCNENLSLNTKDLAQIAERHYKELIK